MSDIELKPFRDGRERGFNRTTDHYEANLVSGDNEYDEQIHYVSDHHICELFIRGVNWREFGEIAMRVGEPISNDVMLLKEDSLQFSITHDFKPLRDSGGAVGSAMNVAEGASTLARGIAETSAGVIGTTDLMIAPLRLFDARFYEGTEPLDLSTSFTFRMGQAGLWDAKKEVFDPLIALLVMLTATDENRRLKFLGAGETEGDDLGFPTFTTPGPSKYALIGALGTDIVNNTLEDVSREDTVQTVANFINNLSADAADTVAEGSVGTITFIIGMTHEESEIYSESMSEEETELGEITRRSMNNRNVFYFDPCYIDSISVEMSPEKDMRGYPITGSVQLSIKTMMGALSNDFTAIKNAEDDVEREGGELETDATTSAAPDVEPEEEE